MSGPKAPPKIEIPLPGESEETPVAPRVRYPDFIEGVMPALGTHILAGAHSAGKTAFWSWALAEIMHTGQFLGHAAQLPAWVRLFVFDRGEDDWEYWCGKAGIPVPKGYWVRKDRALSGATIRGWAKAPEKALEHFRRKLTEMEPEPGGLIITDGGIALLGAATIPYFEGYANMLESQRITCDDLYLTHLPMCHAAKPKTRGSNNAKARDIDKVNMNAGALGSADTLCYLSTPDELVKDGEVPPPYQHFSWTPHHAKSEKFELARTAEGLFMPYIPPQRPVEDSPVPEKDEGPRKADINRISTIFEIAREASGGIERRALATQLMSRCGISKTPAYRSIEAAESTGTLKEGEDGRLYPVERES